jgi:hypothetical protein
VLGDDEVGLAGPGRVFLVRVLAVQEDHDVGVVLDGSGVPQIVDHRLPVDALLGTAVEGGDRDDREAELLSEEFRQRAISEISS